jgi:hypothetical protein
MAARHGKRPWVTEFGGVPFVRKPEGKAAAADDGQQACLQVSIHGTAATGTQRLVEARAIAAVGLYRRAAEGLGPTRPEGAPLKGEGFTG